MNEHKITENQVLLGELISSAHDMSYISQFLLKMKNDYLSIYNNFNFRLVVTDWSWAMIHSIVEQINRQDIHEYAQFIFDFAKGDSEINQNKSYIILCASHVMKNVADHLRKLKFSEFIHKYACFCFSLLLNSTHLVHSSEIFRLICIVFLSKNKTKLVVESINEISKLLAEQPDYDLIEKTINKDFKSFNTCEEEENNSSISSNGSNESETDNSSDEEEENKIKVQAKRLTTIKGLSPFTDHYRKIKEKVENDLKEDDSTDSPENDYYMPEFIDFLLEKMLPYAFLWSGFVLRGTGLTRLKNGTLEAYNGYKKNKVRKNRLPHNYIREGYESVDGQAMAGDKTKISEKTNVKRMKDFECDGDNKYACEEHHDKKRKLSFVAPKPISMGYQSTVDTDKLKNQCEKKENKKSLFANNGKKVEQQQVLVKNKNGVKFDINTLLIKTTKKAWLSNFIMEKYLELQHHDSPVFFINSEAAHSILIRNQYNESLYEDVRNF